MNRIVVSHMSMLTVCPLFNSNGAAERLHCPNANDSKEHEEAYREGQLSGLVAVN